MPKSMRVKTRFEADDDISKVARRIEKNMVRMNRSIRKGFNNNTRAAKSFQSTFKGILAAGAVQRGLGALQQGVRETAVQFASFDDAITAAAVRFKDIGPDAENFTEQLDIIKKAARDAGRETVFTATQSAQALDFLARAGFTSAEAMGSLNSMMNLATATGTEFAEAADWSSDLLGAFGLAVDDSAQKIKNLERLNDVLVKTSNSANVTLEDLFETMKTIGPIASGILKVSLEDVSAQTAIMGNSGIKGTIAMTALKNAYLNLAAPAGEASQIMRMFNISLKDGKGGVRTLTDVLGDLDKAMQLRGVDPVDQAKIMDVIFGKRAIAGAKNLMDNIRNVDKFKKSLLEAGGTAKKTADIIETSLGNEVKQLGSAFLDFGFTALDPWEKDMKAGIKSLTEFVKESAKNLAKRQKKMSEQQFIDRKVETGLTKEQTAALGAGFGVVTPKTVIPARVPDDPRRPAPKEPQGQRASEAQKVQAEMMRMFSAASPNFNISVNQNIDSENINVETTIDAPGASGKVVRNNF